MSENPNPQSNAGKPLDETQLAMDPASVAAQASGQASDPTLGHTADHVTAQVANQAPAPDVTTDFDQSDSAPSNPTASQSRNLNRPANQQVFADYRLDAKLGEGGMGRVFKALDQQGRAVAIKLLSPHLACSDEALLRFKQEGYIASQINHPHCVFVHRVDEDRGTPYIAMELMTGKTLKDLVQKEGPLPFREAVRLILQCIDGLIEAHRLGMIHRDIKPANCYLDQDGNVKIGDFGLARSLVDDSELTRTGAFLGTPLFASPEQLLGQKIDERSDIYSLSATLYFLLAGRAPFESPNAAQVIAKIASSDPPPLKDNGVEVPAMLEAVVLRGLARDRNKRYESFQKMRAALLPLMAPQLEIASLPRRAVAAFLDVCIFIVLFRMSSVALETLLGLPVAEIREWRSHLNLVGWFLYLWLCEWLMGWTIGKRIVQLKVVDQTLGMRQSPRWLLLRTAIYIAATESLNILVRLFFGADSEGLDLLVSLGSIALGIGIALITWKRSGHRQLTHEWFSRTETCLAVPQRASVSVQLDLPEWSPPMVGDQGFPNQLGRFAITGRLKTRPGNDWMLANDVSLEREVWIHWLPAGAPPISVDRKSGPTHARMRVIESGLEQGRHWDAFLAPDGVPLTVFIRQGRHLPWPIAHHLICQIVAAAEDAPDQRPAQEMWDAERYWLDSAGRLTYSEADLDVGPASSDFSPEILLQHIALAALPPLHRLRRASRSAKPATPASKDIASLPPRAGLQLLERVANGVTTLPQIKFDLERVHRTADEVTPSMRFVHAATVTLLLSPYIAGVMLLLLSNTIIIAEKHLRHFQKLAALNQIQQSPEHYPQAFTGLTPAERQRWLAQDKLAEISTNKEQVRNELDFIYMHSNPIERLALEAMGLSRGKLDEQALLEEMFTGANASERLQKTGQASVQSPGKSIDIDAPVAIQVGGLLNHQVSIDGYVTKAERDPKFLDADADNAIPINLAVLIPLGLLTIWNGLTRGGLVQMLTGVAVLRRNGLRVGWIRAWIRSLLLFGPFALLAWIALQLETQDVWWMWLTLQIKLVLAFLPAFYLVGALIWPQVAPHDRVCRTAMVPR